MNLRLIEPTPTSETAGQRAWLIVASAIEEALTCPGLPLEDEGSLRRCHQLARTRARVSRLASVGNSPSADTHQ